MVFTSFKNQELGLHFEATERILFAGESNYDSFKAVRIFLENYPANLWPLPRQVGDRYIYGESNLR